MVKRRPGTSREVNFSTGSEAGRTAVSKYLSRI